MSQQRICVFPIPQTSVLPFQTIQLHVFEPRYRAMVKRCVENGELMAVALAEKPIGEKVGSGESSEHILSSNQQSYEPAGVFSAGKVEIVKEFEDGRFLIESTAQDRFRLKKWVQQVPYLVGECERYSPGHIDVEKWQRLQMQMKNLLGKHFAALDKELLSQSESDDVKFFHLLSRFQWPAEEVQKFLELETTDIMADSLLNTLKGVQLVTGGETPGPGLH
jgi:Lon protease-like protein